MAYFTHKSGLSNRHHVSRIVAVHRAPLPSRRLRCSLQANGLFSRKWVPTQRQCTARGQTNGAPDPKKRVRDGLKIRPHGERENGPGQSI